jgi:hypothetical protein
MLKYQIVEDLRLYRGLGNTFGTIILRHWGDIMKTGNLGDEVIVEKREITEIFDIDLH